MGGTLSITSGDHSESGGFVYGSDSWVAPASVQFNGFAYTSADFSSVSDNVNAVVGGVSAGFGADGSAAQPSILFPWTDDCSITNSGHDWTNTNASRVAGTSGQQTCNTSGSNTGWNYTNSELENTNPGINPEANYHTLWLTVFCQAATCNYDSSKESGAGGASVSNLSGNFVDPNNQPAGSVSWGSAVQAGAWYQTNRGGLTLDLSASDPAGVCAMYADLSGASSVTTGVIGNQGPGVTNVGGEIGEEFGSGTDPCWTGTADTGTWILPGSLPSGSYSASISAANPGDYQAQGFSAAGSPHRGDQQRRSRHRRFHARRQLVRCADRMDIEHERAARRYGGSVGALVAGLQRQRCRRIADPGVRIHGVVRDDGLDCSDGQHGRE